MTDGLRWLLPGLVLVVAACDRERAANAAQGADPATLAHGEKLYTELCASCHGQSGEGAPDWQEQQMTAMGEMPPPPHDSAGHTWRHSDALLYRIVEQGWRDPFNTTERLTMPPFGDTLDPWEIRAVIEYLKTLWTPDQRRFQAAESRGAPYPDAALEP